MFGLGFPEIVIILVAVGVLFFGGKKISEFAKGMGRFTGEFKKGRIEIEKELREVERGTEEVGREVQDSVPGGKSNGKRS